MNKLFIQGRFLLAILLLGASNNSFSQRGKDGAHTVAGNSIVNEYTRLTATATSGSVFLSVQAPDLNTNGRFSGNLQPGDLLLVIQVQGAQINGMPNPDPVLAASGLPNDITWGSVLDYRNVGLYEYIEVKTVTSTTQIELMCGLQNNYTLGGFNEKVMVVRVPRYTSLTIGAGATLTCDSWNGQTGGIVAAEVLGNTVINGQIDVSEKGYRGGALNNNTGNFLFFQAGNDDTYGGRKGEGIAGFNNELNQFGGSFGKGAPANGGGAGNSHNGGGAGGANAADPTIAWTGKGIPDISNGTWVNAWNLEQAGLAGSRSSGGGKGGYCWSTSNGNAITQGPGNGVWGGHNRADHGGNGGRPLDYSAGRIFFGGGGGAGHQNDGEGGGGGNAAGIVLLNTFGAVNGAGSIRANGQAGTGSNQKPAPFSGQVNKDGSGGGGAGGTILIKNIGAIGLSNLQANGGVGGTQIIRRGVFSSGITEAQGPGGGGGGGYVGLSTLGAAVSLVGGVNGTTNSPSLSEFPPNGATVGDVGFVEQINSNYNFTADNDTICGGGSVTITATITGVLPTAGGQLEWYDSYFSQTSIFTGNSFTTPVLNATKTYYIGGCNIPFKDSVTIVVSPLIIIDNSAISIQHETCVGNNGTITGVTASGGTGTLNYLWNNTQTSSADTVGLAGGTFELVVIDSLGCTDTLKNIVVNATAVPVIDTSLMIKAKDTCGRITGEYNGIVITGGTGSYLYKVDGIIVPSLNVNALAAGIHQVIVIDNNSGCSDTMGIPIDLITAPTLFLGNDTTLCTGQTLLLDGTSPGVTYEWQDASVNPTFTVTVAGIYWLEIDAGGCTVRDSIVVTYTNGTAVNLGNDTALCENETLLLDATAAGATYEWQDFSVNPTFTISTAGQYHVEVDQAGCINRDTINVTYNLITLDLGNDTTLCDLDSLSLDITQTGATYLWSDASTNPTFKIKTSGLYWVEVTIGNCSKRDSIQVTYGIGSATNLGNDTTLCENETLLLDATAAGATYEWQDLSVNPTFTVSTAGQYHVEVDQAGCINRDTINVTYNLITLNLGNDTTLCNSDSLSLDVTQAGATYLWSDASTNPTFKIKTPGLYWAEVTIGNCSKRDSIVVTYNNAPTPNFGNDTTLCTGQNLLLDATAPGSTYQWQDASTNPTYQVSFAGQFHVAANNNGCIGYDTINVLYQNTKIDLGPDITLCDAQTTVLDITTPGATYLWNDASANPTLTVANQGLYWGQVTVGNCTDRDSIVVTYEVSPVINLGNDTLICDDVSLFLDASFPSATYLWDDGSMVPNREIEIAGQYFVRLTNNCGVTNDTINVSTKDCSCNIFMPNAFSPNGDGFNDVYDPVITCDFHQFELRIFNRQGILVYYSEDPLETWDGSYRGGVNESEVYVWNLKYRIIGDIEIQVKRGHVTMVR